MSVDPWHGLDVIVEARSIVLGWPFLGSVEPAGPGRVLLSHEHGAAGIDVTTGAKTVELPDAVERATGVRPGAAAAS